MRRYHEEKHIVENRHKLRKRLNAGFESWLDSLPRSIYCDHADEQGRFRKAWRAGGCGKARCQVCHPEKFPKRIPTRKETQVRQDLAEQQKEL